MLVKLVRPRLLLLLALLLLLLVALLLLLLLLLTTLGWTPCGEVAPGTPPLSEGELKAKEAPAGEPALAAALEEAAGRGKGRRGEKDAGN